MENSILGLLISQIEEDKASIVDHLTSGSIADYPAYKEACGRIYGLSLAQRNIGEMIERVKKQEASDN